MDPHEKVNMDAEKFMPNTWDFEIYGEKNVKKTCSSDEIPYHTPAQDPVPRERHSIAVVKPPMLRAPGSWIYIYIDIMLSD